jgi:hypothetical protein
VIIVEIMNINIVWITYDICVFDICRSDNLNYNIYPLVVINIILLAFKNACAMWKCARHYTNALLVGTSSSIKGTNSDHVRTIWSTFLIILIIYFVFCVSVNVRHIFVYFSFEVNVSIK